ncbi:MAG: molybdopterin-dependent oxidoreductase [Gordonibacter sp.]|uniref:molybdopterin-dependent oxidoreductase n=1 Tax=Gordonibacter sp. TaxID=1968902 RepID=UPI002FC97332
MEKEMDLAPSEFVKDGKFTRRTFVKGAGWITVTSALGFGLAGCAPKDEGGQTRAAETSADPEEGFTYGHACCNLNCSSHCHLKSHIKDGKIVTVTPGAVPGREDYASACLRGIALSQKTQDENARVMYPMKRVGERGSGEFERISWEQAIDEIAQKLLETKEKYGEKAAGFYSFTGNSGNLSMSAPIRFASMFGGTNFDIEGIMGDHGASMGMILAYGVKRGSHDTRDYLNSNMIVLWGRNIADTHTSEFRYLVQAREKGAKIVVVDPRLCSSAAIADQWIPIKPQTDPALALGMMNVIIANDLHDKEWLAAHSVSPFLVKESDGSYLLDGEDWMVWDAASGSAKKYNSEGVMPTLSGTFDVNGEAVRTAFDHLVDEASKYTLSVTAQITGLPEDVIETFAMEYARAKPAGIRMGQGMQRVWNSFSSFRAIATLAAVAGYVGIEGGGASHMGGNPSVKASPDFKEPALMNKDWADTGGMKPNTVKTSTMYDQIIDKDPYPIDFMWFANSNFVNMSPDANKIVDKVLPSISTIVTVDPYWTWTARQSDYVLPACNYWEKWDIEDRSPWVIISKPMIDPMGESKSDVEIMSLLAQKVGLEKFWNKTDEEWCRGFPNTAHPAWEGFDFDKVAQEGIFARADALFEPQIFRPDGTFPTPSKRFQLYNEELVPYDEQVPSYKPMLEDPAGELGQKYPLVYLQFHDRLNVHSQHVLIPELSVVQSEPLLEMNPVDAASRGLAHGDVALIKNDRGACKMKVFLTEGIHPGAVATASGWTPDYFIEGNYQMLTHLTINPTEEFISQTSTAFYDVLVEVEKA